MRNEQTAVLAPPGIDTHPAKDGEATPPQPSPCAGRGRSPTF